VIDSQTQLYCIIGSPVRHSFSPNIHNAAFQALGLNAVYTAFDVSDLESAVRGIRALGIAGASVTIPHKVDVIPYLDEVSDIAKMIGSVNTIVNDQGRLTGTNTDAFGFYQALTEKTDITDKTIAVFGAGGSGKAICFSLFYHGGPGMVYIVGSKSGRKEALRDRIRTAFSETKKADGKIESVERENWKDIQSRADIIINATPLGMDPDIGTSPLTPDEIPEGKVVMDIVYNPGETLLLKHAAKKGCKLVHGIDMLLYQGAKQFELWTGKPAPVSVMRDALNKAVYKK
jgi:shikimate dehydrogenase